MPERLLVLASASPARLRLLRDAGFDPTVVVSGVDETVAPGRSTPEVVVDLAVRKAEAVLDADRGAVVVACDSLLEFAGERHGKPEGTGQARRWLEAMRGRSGVLHTGHCVVDEATGRRAAAVASTTVHFATTTDEELDAYLGTGEAAAVAGAFTLDGRSAPFVDGIEGDHGAVIGLSLPTFRTLLAEIGLTVPQLWAD